MDLLDPRGAGRVDVEAVIRHAQSLTAIVAGKGDGRHARLRGLAKSFEHIGRSPAGGDTPGDVPLLTEGLDLSGEDEGKIRIVADAGQEGGVGGQGDGRQGGPVEEKAVDEFCGDMLGVGGAAAVAEDEDFVALTEGVRYAVDYLYDGIDIVLEETLFYLQALLNQM